ncbi:hypothetical protein MASR2M78_05590 [Treponema sp.]
MEKPSYYYMDLAQTNLTAMRELPKKAAGEKGQDPLNAAMTTETSSAMEGVSDLLSEVAEEEHEYMKNNPPGASNAAGPSSP